MENSKPDTAVEIVGRSAPFLSILETAERAARSQANILLSGESGTGKEVVAKFIHNQSGFRHGPFIPINCSAIPSELLESELYGHAKGAFSGAIEKKVGLIEEAENGTLFLDEVGDLALPLQAKILRVLQERRLKRVGENAFREVHIRLISATHKNLAEEVRAKNFREDLFFRLNVIPLHLPPLRERKEDILPLALFFLAKYAVSNKSRARNLSAETVELLMRQRWQGNVRELENAVERAVVLSSSETISPNDFKFPNSQSEESFSALERNEKDDDEAEFNLKLCNGLLSLDEVIHRYINFAVSKNGGAKDKTARELGIDRKTLYKRISFSVPSH